MKICIAQTKPQSGNIAGNMEAHIELIDHALTFDAEAIFFPELSLTGYEPKLAQSLATTQTDSLLDVFQKISDDHTMIIGLGLPTIAASDIRISTIIFEPNKTRQTYSKQELHADELPYFESGLEQVIIKTNDSNIAPAICYESLLPSHAKNAFRLGANIYLASVAKSENGLDKAFRYYPTIAKQYGMPVLMSNCVGFCDNFLSAGKSAVWKKDGELIGQLDDKSRGILIFDTESEKIIQRILTDDKTHKAC
jgi:predicted amidohydrolase